MDTRKHLLMIDGEDKSDSIASFHFANGKCNVVFTSSPKVYNYHASNVQVLNLQRTIKPQDLIVRVKGSQLSNVDQILDYGAFYKIISRENKDFLCLKSDVVLEANCLTNKSNLDLFNYFKETAHSISLVTENEINILDQQFKKIKVVSNDTALASYIDPSIALKKLEPPSPLIYPFGLNQSQKVAIENAFSSQVSIIQGPPGTGKTQTILNIIANAVLMGKTVAVVSNNNSAVENVAEKLEKKGVSFITAFLGSLANKEAFIESQNGQYPDLSLWSLSLNEREKLKAEVKNRTIELNKMLDAKNRIAEINREFLEMKPEQFNFKKYYSSISKPTDIEADLSALPSQKILTLWLEYENLHEGYDDTLGHGDRDNDPGHKTHEFLKIGLFKKLIFLFRYGREALKLFRYSPLLAIPYLQQQFYLTRSKELTEEKTHLEKKLKDYSFDLKMEELQEKSLKLFRGKLADRYNWREGRRVFEPKEFRSKSAEFNKEYPVILSTTYSIKGTLDVGHIYDYLIIDEASQVDIATGVLAFSCGRNVVIVGDQKQLPNVLTEEDVEKADEIWSRYSFDEKYKFSNHSLLSSATAVWGDAPSVLLREHYRCHPKIAEFCNQKFYDGKLIVMTEDLNEPNVLSMYRTVEGNHARGHFNQRQIDVIKSEILPKLALRGYRSTGIITPYRKQVAAIRSQLGDQCEVATVHKFQGREKDAIILTTVDNVIGDFVDDPHMLNVAVSRAAKSLSVIISQDKENDRSNYGDLAKYIEYNNCEIVDSSVFSIFDLLYKAYADKRKLYLQKHKRVSEYDSENLMYSVIESILKKDEFSKIGCALHVSLISLINDYSLLDDSESKYARNPLTHTDFLLFNKMNKSPIMAIEVDGTSYHVEGSKQAQRDIMKNRIFEKCGIPLVRIRTDESEEGNRIEKKLRECIS